MSALDRELLVLRGFCSCLGDDKAVDEAEKELAELRKYLRKVLDASAKDEIFLQNLISENAELKEKLAKNE
jgi:hypothetical protein